MGVARFSPRLKHPHEPIVASEPQQPKPLHHHSLSHFPCRYHAVEDCALEQATGVQYDMSY
jgi:hypothetical protein